MKKYLQNVLSSRCMQWFLVPLAYTVLTLVLTFPMISRLATSLNSWGDPQLQTWILAWNAHALQTPGASVWNAPIFYPYPDTLAYTDHHLLLSLVSAPIIWLTGNAVLAYNVLVLLSFVLSAWAMYGLVNHLINQRGIAFLAGIAFAFAPFRMAQIFHLQLLQTAWMVWALLFAHRLLFGRRKIDAEGHEQRVNGQIWDAVWLGFFIGLQAIAALYYAFFVLFAIGGLVIWWFGGQLIQRWRNRVPFPYPMLWKIGLSGLIAAVLALPFIVPYLRVYKTLGIVRSMAELNNWSAPLVSYLTITDHTLGSRLGLSVNSGEWVLFPGILVTLLTVYAVVWRPRREIWFWLVLALGAFALSLGTGIRLTRDDPVRLALPFYGLLYNHLPGFGALRVPTRWGLLVTLAFVILAAYGLQRLLERGSVHWQRSILITGMLFALIELSSMPLRTTNPAALQTVPPVYAWLSAPEQREIKVVLELPQGATPRGAELERMTWRMFNSRYHWKALPVAFSGLIPFGTTELLAELQNLPSEKTLRYLQIVGVDTLVLQRNEYEPAQLTKLVQGLQASPLVAWKADIGDTSVYTILPNAELQQIETEIAAGSILIDNDERMPGMLALSLVRRWQQQGREVYGKGRLKYYADLLPLQQGQGYRVGVFAEQADPRAFGFDQSGLRWKSNGLALYLRDPQVRATFDLAQYNPKQTHPVYPSTLNLTLAAEQIQLNARSVQLETSLAEPTLTIAVASLIPQNIQIGSTTMPISAGVSLIQVPVGLGDLVIQGEQSSTALLWLWVTDGLIASSPLKGIAVQVQPTLQASQLTIQGSAAGEGSLLIDIWGAAADNDRPIHALHQEIQVTPQTFPVTLDLRQPTEPPWIDGRYIVYLKSSVAPDAEGLPIATFMVRNQQLLEQRGVIVPLTKLP